MLLLGQSQVRYLSGSTQHPVLPRARYLGLCRGPRPEIRGGLLDERSGFAEGDSQDPWLTELKRYTPKDLASEVHREVAEEARAEASHLDLLWAATQRLGPSTCECCGGSGRQECQFCGSTGSVACGLSSRPCGRCWRLATHASAFDPQQVPHGRRLGGGWVGTGGRPDAPVQRLQGHMRVRPRVPG